MILFIARVRPGLKSKGVAGELYVNTQLLPSFLAARNHSAEWSRTTHLTGGASTLISRLVNTIQIYRWVQY